jgi:F-type H+-transporting ATPase subunit epsilon
MADRITLDLVTPEKLVLTGDFTMVTATSVMGEFGVLPGHAPLLTLLRPGLVVAKRDDEETVFAAQSGFAEVEPDRVIILTERAVAGKDVDVEDTQKQLTEAEARHKACVEDSDSAEFKMLGEKVEWLRAMLEAAARTRM